MEAKENVVLSLCRSHLRRLFLYTRVSFHYYTLLTSEFVKHLHKNLVLLSLFRTCTFCFCFCLVLVVGVGS